MSIVYGVIKKIVYFDENRSFGIVTLQLDYKDQQMATYRPILFDNKLSILSNFDRKPIIDEEYEFEGEFEVNKYGNQLRAKRFKRLNEDTLEGIVTYLSSDSFPGIGKVSAKKVYDALGSNCLNLIIEDKTVLEKVDLTNDQKNIIYDNLLINYKKEKQLLNFLGVGISLRLATRIISLLGEDAFNIMKNDPYQLIELVDGIGFIKADTIALSLGIKQDDPKRLKAIILYVLNEYMYSTGNTFIHIGDLYIRCNNFNKDIYFENDLYNEYIGKLIVDKKIIIENNIFVFDSKIYKEEVGLSSRIVKFLDNEIKDYSLTKIDKVIDTVMLNNKIEYSNKQYEAIKKALSNSITIITGGPGTGKSTIIKGIVDSIKLLYEEKDVLNDVYLLAPTGRAAKRLKEVTKCEAQTIHKFLGYEGGYRFNVSEENPVYCKVLIIDEFSMVDLSIAYRLFSSINSDCRVILVGDADQLPSVGPGNVLKDLIDSKEITTIFLDRIHRQASDSSIIKLAHSINGGMLPDDFSSFHHDFAFYNSIDENISSYIEHLVKDAIDKGFDLIKDIQVLIPIYKGIVGIEAINQHLQAKFNPSTEEIFENGKKYKVNDKVIQLVNRTDKNVMNGDIGYIYHIKFVNEKFESLSVMFDNGLVDYTKDELDDLTLAYAISIHKSQGSEFAIVIVPISFKYFMMLKRKLIYTAITRAKKYLFIVGNFDAIRKGIVELEDNRSTQLVYKIKQLLNKNFDEDSELENISPYDFM